MCHILKDQEWSRELRSYKDGGLKYNPSAELLEYVNNMVKKKWSTIKDGLQTTGIVFTVIKKIFIFYCNSIIRLFCTLNVMCV